MEISLGGRVGIIKAIVTASKSKSKSKSSCRQVVKSLMLVVRCRIGVSNITGDAGDRQGCVVEKRFITIIWTRNRYVGLGSVFRHRHRTGREVAIVTRGRCVEKRWPFVYVYRGCGRERKRIVDVSNGKDTVTPYAVTINVRRTCGQENNLNREGIKSVAGESVTGRKDWPGGLVRP